MIHDTSPARPSSHKRSTVIAVTVSHDLYNQLADEADFFELSMSVYGRYVLSGATPPWPRTFGFWLDQVLLNQMDIAGYVLTQARSSHSGGHCPSCTAPQDIRAQLHPIVRPCVKRVGAQSGRIPQFKTSIPSTLNDQITRRARRAGLSLTDFVHKLLVKREVVPIVRFEPAVDPTISATWIDTLRFWSLAGTTGALCDQCHARATEQISRIADAAPPWPETKMLRDQIMRATHLPQVHEEQPTQPWQVTAEAPADPMSSAAIT